MQLIVLLFGATDIASERTGMLQNSGSYVCVCVVLCVCVCVCGVCARACVR